MFAAVVQPSWLPYEVNVHPHDGPSFHHPRSLVGRVICSSEHTRRARLSAACVADRQGWGTARSSCVARYLVRVPAHVCSDAPCHPSERRPARVVSSNHQFAHHLTASFSLASCSRQPRRPTTTHTWLSSHCHGDLLVRRSGLDLPSTSPCRSATDGERIDRRSEIHVE